MSSFPETHWSLVRRATSPDAESRRDALTTIIKRYQPALQAYLWNKRRIAGEQAEELLQAFIVDRVLDYGLLCYAEEGRGRFRSFLLTSLDHFAISRFRRERLRGTTSDFRRMDQMPAPCPAADSVAEAAWARTLIQGVLREMEAECRRTGRMDIWTVFRRRVLAEIYDNSDPPRYEELATELQLSSPMQAANLLVTAKRMYARLLRDAVAEYESTDSSIEFEIAELRRALEADSGMKFGSIDD